MLGCQVKKIRVSFKYRALLCVFSSLEALSCKEAWIFLELPVARSTEGSLLVTRLYKRDNMMQPQDLAEDHRGSELEVIEHQDSLERRGRLVRSPEYQPMHF